MTKSEPGLTQGKKCKCDCEEKINLLNKKMKIIQEYINTQTNIIRHMLPNLGGGPDL